MPVPGAPSTDPKPPEPAAAVPKPEEAKPAPAPPPPPPSLPVDQLSQLSRRTLELEELVKKPKITQLSAWAVLVVAAVACGAVFGLVILAMRVFGARDERT